MNIKKLLVLLVIVGFIAAFFGLGLDHYLSLEYFKTERQALQAFTETHPWQAGLWFFALYVIIAGLSLPGAALLTLVAGALFGMFVGTLIVSLASSLGATLAFLSARFLLRDSIQRRFAQQLRRINQGIEREGAFYLFSLRLVPIFPFFVINLAMGLTSMGIWPFYWVSQLGMLPGTIVYVNAGTQIAQIESLSGIVSLPLLLSFALLGIFPLVAKRLLELVKRQRVLRAYPKPRRFDTNLVVIGAGSAGLVAAYIAAAVKARVTLIEKHRMGGECLHTGCVPSKTLLRSAKILSYLRRAEAFGLKPLEPRFDFNEVMARVRRVIQHIAPHDSIERYTGLGVNCLVGEARITSPYSVTVNGQVITTRNLIIATGSRPWIPPLPGLDRIPYLTSDTVWELEEQPQRLLVLGGGPIGCELIQAFARLGSQVTLVELAPRLLLKEDEEVSELIKQKLLQEGIDVRIEHEALEVLVEDEKKQLLCRSGDKQVRLGFDALLVAVGRIAHTEGLGLEPLGITLDQRGAVEVDEYLQTRIPTIYACGDVVGTYQFTHTASHQAYYAAVNALFGGLKRSRVDYSVIPWATFTDPEVARVGLNEHEAKAQDIAYELTRYDLQDLDRAIAEEEAQGFVKVLTVPGKDKILGVTIVGHHAADLIAEFVQAMRHGLGLKTILRTIHIYPTLAEANKHAAGAWRRAHTSNRALRWLARYHAWRRGRSVHEP